MSAFDEFSHIAPHRSLSLFHVSHFYKFVNYSTFYLRGICDRGFFTTFIWRPLRSMLIGFGASESYIHFVDRALGSICDNRQSREMISFPFSRNHQELIRSLAAVRGFQNIMNISKGYMSNTFNSFIKM